jgi:hypothetical protein
LEVIVKDLVLVKAVPRRYGLPLDFKVVVALLSMGAGIELLACVLFAVGMANVAIDQREMTRFFLARTNLVEGIYFGVRGVLSVTVVMLVIRMSKVGWWVCMSLSVYGLVSSVRQIGYPGAVISVLMSVGLIGWLLWRRELFGKVEGKGN